jgi:hypothetical protein
MCFALSCVSFDEQCTLCSNVIEGLDIENIDQTGQDTSSTADSSHVLPRASSSASVGNLTASIPELTVSGFKENMSNLMPVLGFTHMRCNRLDLVQFIEQNKECEKMWMTNSENSIYKGFKDNMNHYGYYAKRGSGGETEWYWNPSLAVTKIQKACTKQNLRYNAATVAFERTEQSDVWDGKTTTKPTIPMRMICPDGLLQLVQSLTPVAPEEMEYSEVFVFKSTEEVQKVISMQHEPEKYFFPLVGLDDGLNDSLFTMKSRQKKLVKMPVVLNLTSSHFLELVLVNEVLRKAHEEKLVKIFGPKV